MDTSAFVKSLNGKPVAVFGLGISNMAAIRALTRAGASVTAWDDKEEKFEGAKAAGADIKNLMEEDLSAYGVLVLAPGVPFTLDPHPVVARAQEAGLEVVCDIEILHRCNHGCAVVGVTGTNGKSTTTTLIGHILNNSGKTALVGGNIGKPVLDFEQPKAGDIIVLELSSFQLDLCPTFAPDIGVHLNLTPDHIDRHGTLDAYTAAKQRMFRGAGHGVMAIDDEISRGMLERVREAGQRTCVPVSISGRTEGGVYMHEGAMLDEMQGDAKEIFRPMVATLPGTHNQQNITAAYAACRILGVDAEKIVEAVKTYPGLPHRQFLVRIINGMPYINDSKATNAAATERALACYRKIYWIVGGLPKEGGLNGLDSYMDRIRHAFLIGQAAEDFADWLKKRGVPHTISGTMDKAVEDAHALAQAERGEPGGMGTVLLSPACASYDQFRNFEDRGETFARFVNALPEEEGA